MVVDFDIDARLDQPLHHDGAEVLLAIGRRHGEIPLLDARSVAEVRGTAVPAGIPDAFLGVDVIEAAVRVLTEAEIIEDVKLDFRAEEGLRGDAGARDVRFRLLRDVARVAAVWLMRDRVHDIADDREGRHLQGGINHCGGRDREEEHVALVNLLETADRGTIEADTLREHARIELARRDREMLPHTEQIDELDINELHARLLDHLQDIFCLGICTDFFHYCSHDAPSVLQSCPRHTVYPA